MHKGVCPTTCFRLNLHAMNVRFLRALLPLALVFTMMSCSNETEVSQDPISQKSQSALIQEYDYTAEELALADAINEHRTSIGLNPLGIINYISLKSEEHNAYMIANNVVNHDQFAERSQDIIAALGAMKVNENVAYNYESANSVLHAWLESPAHKANIEGDFTNFGVSVSIDPETGKKYYTNIFIKK
jgi:uncharacterized protein YkwD